VLAELKKYKCEPARRKNKHRPEENPKRGIRQLVSKKEHEPEKINNSSEQYRRTQKFYYQIHNNRQAGITY
jgi:hypothetical protein